MKNPNNSKQIVWKDTAKSIPQMERENPEPGYEFYLNKQVVKDKPANPRLN